MYILCIHSSINGHLGCFPVLSIVNSTTMDIGVHVSFQIMAFSRYMTGSEIAGSFVVQSLSCIWLFVNPWTAACQASLSFTISLSLLKLLSIETVMTSNHLTCCPNLLLPSIFLSIRVFSKELGLHIRWPKYWTFSFSISPAIFNDERPKAFPLM